MKILLTNDDGYLAPGIFALYEALSTVAEVTVVAPDRERSATGMAITLTKPLRYRKFILPEGMQGYFIDGTPADCVKMGNAVLLDEKPDYVFSGINQGSNVGLNSNYSGTVAAAVEGAILGIPSIAISLASFSNPDFSAPVSVALKLLEKLENTTLEPYTLLSVNVPAVPVDKLKGIRMARVGHCLYREVFDKRIDTRSRDYYWMGGVWREFNHVEDGDHSIVEMGYAAVTPLKVDWTAEETRARLKEEGWDEDFQN
ncbi:5'/3'-nucleotidase SurE [bacterium]|nr:5'/3'-nucleotidase SurE [bacterium]